MSPPRPGLFGRPLVLAAFLTSALAGACGGSGGGGSALEGIYMVTSWTENDASCDAEGPSVLADKSQSMFYLKVESFFGATFMNVKFCDDVPDCTMLATDPDTIHLGSMALDGSDGAGWASGTFQGFSSGGADCEGTYVSTELSTPADGQIKIESRGQAAGGFPPDSDGFCDDADGQAAAQGQPCTELEVFTATQVGTF